MLRRRPFRLKLVDKMEERQSMPAATMATMAEEPSFDIRRLIVLNLITHLASAASLYLGYLAGTEHYPIIQSYPAHS